MGYRLNWIHSFDKELLNTCFVPGTVLCIGIRQRLRQTWSPYPSEAYSLVRGGHRSKQKNYNFLTQNCNRREATGEPHCRERYKKQKHLKAQQWSQRSAAYDIIKTPHSNSDAGSLRKGITLSIKMKNCDKFSSWLKTIHTGCLYRGSCQKQRP